jgi:hypothetical protein
VWRHVEAKTMTQHKAAGALPIDGVSLAELAQQMGAREWEESAQAKKELASAGGRILTLAGSGWGLSTHLRSDGSARPGFYRVIQPDRAKATNRADLASQAVCGVVREQIKTGLYKIQGVPKDGHEPVDISAALFSSMRIISLQKSIIAGGKRRFDCVRVFSTLPVVLEAAAMPPLRSSTTARSISNKPRPKGDAVAAALKTVGLDRSRGSLSLKEVAGQIASLMKPVATTASELDALAKAIKRHYERTIKEGRAGNVVALNTKKPA